MIMQCPLSKVNDQTRMKLSNVIYHDENVPSMPPDNVYAPLLMKDVKFLKAVSKDSKKPMKPNQMSQLTKKWEN